MQVQDLPQNSDHVAIEDAETETKSEDLEVSDIDKTELQHKTDIRYRMISVYSKYLGVVCYTYLFANMYFV